MTEVVVGGYDCGCPYFCLHLICSGGGAIVVAATITIVMVVCDHYLAYVTNYLIICDQQFNCDLNFNNL